MAKRSDKANPQGGPRGAQHGRDALADLLSKMATSSKGIPPLGLSMPSTVFPSEGAPAKRQEATPSQDIDQQEQEIARIRSIEVISYTARFIACNSRGRQQKEAVAAELHHNSQALFHVLKPISDIFRTQEALREQAGDYLCSLVKERWDTAEFFVDRNSNTPGVADAPRISDICSFYEFNKIFPLPDTILPAIRDLARGVAEMAAHHPVFQERLRRATLPGAAPSVGQNLVQLILAVNAMFNPQMEYKLTSIFFADSHAGRAESLLVTGPTTELMRAFQQYWCSHFIHELAHQLKSPTFFAELSRGAAEARYMEHYFKRADWKNFDGLIFRLQKHAPSLEDVQHAVEFLKNQEQRRDLFTKVACDVECFAARNSGGTAQSLDRGPRMNLMTISRGEGEPRYYLCLWAASGDAKMYMQESSAATRQKSDIVKAGFRVPPESPSDLYSGNINPSFRLTPEDSVLWVGRSEEAETKDPFEIARAMYHQLDRIRARVTERFPHIVCQLDELGADKVLVVADDDGVSISFPSNRLKEMESITGLTLPVALHENDAAQSATGTSAAREELLVLSLPWENAEGSSTVEEKDVREPDLQVAREGDIFALRQCKKLLRECAFTNGDFIGFLEKHWSAERESGKGSHLKIFLGEHHFTLGKDMRAPSEPLGVTVAARMIQKLGIPLDEMMQKLRERLE